MRFLSVLFFLFPTTLLAQQAGWQELTIANGLSQGMVYDLKQDTNGFIWVATKDGLNRYDGYNFNVFTHDPYNPASISDNACSALLVDKKGRLWVGTLNNGLNLYDARQQRFYHVDISDDKLTNAGNYEIRLLAEDPDGNIWINTDQDRLYKLTLPDKLKTDFPDSLNFTSQVQLRYMTMTGMATNASAHHIQFNADGTALVGATYGMCAFNWRQMTDMRPINRPPNVPVRQWNFVDDTGGGNYWFSANTTHIHGWFRGKHTVIRLPNRTISVLVDMLGTNLVAVATLQYLWLMSPDQLMAQDSLTAQNAFAVMPPIPLGLRELIKDQTGSIWIGTAGYGLRVFNAKVKQFKTYLPGMSPTQLMRTSRGACLRTSL